MEKQRFVFISYISNYGGIETLIIRMGKWLQKQGYSSMVITDSEREEDKILLKELEGIMPIYRVPFRGFHKICTWNDWKLSPNDALKLVVFSYPAYLIADEIRRQIPGSQILFYDPHQYGLILEFYVNHSVLKKAAHIWAKNLVKRMEAQHELAYMDGLCMERTARTYGCSSRPDLVIPLAMKIEEFNEQKIIEKYKRESFHILTIARMEFPFKGYVIGLIDVFERLCKEYSNLHLDLIGDGSNGKQLKKRMDSLEPAVKKRVDWHGNVPYHDLDSYFHKAKLYIGMGTTVLDAANHGVVSLPVGSYTYRCKGYGFLYEDPMNLGGIGGRTEIAEKIRQVLSFSQEAYRDCVKRQLESIRPLYDIDGVMHQFLVWKNTSHASILYGWERAFIQMGRIAFRIRREMQGCSYEAFRNALKRHPRLFSLLHKAGITALRIPVIITGKMRKYGLIRDKNTVELERYKNSHLGERCVLVANGPSLLPEDLDKIKGEWTFGCNKIYYMFPKTQWRPDFYCVLDERYIERSQDEIFSQIDMPIFTNDVVYKKISEKNREGKKILYSRQIHYERFQAWPHLLEYTYATNQGTVLSFVMALAIYMGFKEIYVLGADNTATVAGNHFSGHLEDKGLEQIQKERLKKNGWGTHHWKDQMELEMATFEAYAKAHGISIYNVTRGGQLNAFERKEFDEVFQ